MHSLNSYDVIICGGGLAGQTLARQLRLQHPQLTLLLLDKTVFPLPEAACKVGESTVELSAFYFQEKLQLQDYFKNNHYKKLGFRFFTGNSQGPFEDRAEVGISHFAPYDSFQIDRGIFENDLFTMNKLLGIEVLEGMSVNDIRINPSTENSIVEYKEKNTGETFEAAGRWVIDAMGRRCLLQRKFNLKVPPPDMHSAAWFRLRGRIDIENFVPLDNVEWHTRVPYKTRFFSTNHIMGRGYWVWFIPLSSGNTSVGIVTAEKVHPLNEYRTFEKAMEWLRKNEPVVYQHIRDCEFMDFETMKNYSYSSQQVISPDRWACVGEAALFPDPFYSPGSNMIAYENSIVTKLIGDDFNNALQPADINRYNHFIINTNEWVTYSIHSFYDYFGHEQIMPLALIWDVAFGWSFGTSRMFNDIYLDAIKSEALAETTARAFSLDQKLRKLLEDWCASSDSRYCFDYIDYLSIPFVQEIYRRNLQTGKSVETLRADYALNLQAVEEFVQVVFLLAVEDLFPERAGSFRDVAWLNAWAVSLQPDAWDWDTLVLPAPDGRSLTAMKAQISRLFKVSTPEPAENSLQVTFNF